MHGFINEGVDKKVKKDYHKGMKSSFFLRAPRVLSCLLGEFSVWCGNC